MQIYIKRSKNRTASGVFLHSLILHPPPPARTRTKTPKRCAFRQKTAQKRTKTPKRCAWGAKSTEKRTKWRKRCARGRKARKSAGNQGTDVYDSRLKLNPVAEAGHYRDQGHLLPFPRAVIVDDGERIVAVQGVVHAEVQRLQMLPLECEAAPQVQTESGRPG